MRPFTSSACIAAFCFMIGGAAAQTSPEQKVTPGNAPTQAVGSQIAPMKCPDNTTASGSQGQHAPTAGTGQQVPQMTAQADCPGGKPTEQKK
jgi:hypothetical protein